MASKIDQGWRKEILRLPLPRNRHETPTAGGAAVVAGSTGESITDDCLAGASGGRNQVLVARVWDFKVFGRVWSELVEPRDSRAKEKSTFFATKNSVLYMNWKSPVQLRVGQVDRVSKFDRFFRFNTQNDSEHYLTCLPIGSPSNRPIQARNIECNLDFFWIVIYEKPLEAHPYQCVYLECRLLRQVMFSCTIENQCLFEISLIWSSMLTRLPLLYASCPWSF